MRFLAVLLGLSLSLPLAAAPIRITGRVSAEAGALSSARVEVFPAYEGYADSVRRLTVGKGPVPLAQARTNAEGAFEMQVPESGGFRVVLRAEGYLPIEVPFLPLVEDVELQIPSMIPASRVEVRTAGPDGKPLAGVEVRSFEAYPWGRPQEEDSLSWRIAPLGGTTGPDGRASLPGVKQYGLPAVAATSPRFLGQTATGSPGSTLTLRLTPAAGWIEARDAGGKPVPGALARWHGWPVGITGADGRLEIAGPPGDSGLVLESREGWQARVARTATPGVLPVRLAPPRRIAGRVVDSASRKPVAGALVWSGSPLVSPPVRTGPDGAFILEVPAAEEGWLKAGAAGFLPGERQLAKKGAAEPVVLALSPSASISGAVVDSDGRPVEGAEVSLGLLSGQPGPHGISGRVRSQAGGGFRFDRLPPGGTFELTATHPGFARASITARATPAGQPAPPVRIVMNAGQTAFGKVVDSGGRPLAGAEVTLTTESRERFEAASDETGRFEIRHLLPGVASVRATHSGYAPALREEVAIPSGKPAFDLGTLKLPPAEAIEGRVTDSRGTPLAGAVVMVDPDTMSFSGRFMDPHAEEPLRTGPDGSFRAEGLEGGRRYNVSVWREGYVNVSLPGVEAPTAEPLKIELKAARTLSGQVVGPEGEPVAGASLSLIEERRIGDSWSSGTTSLGTTDAEGRFRVSGPPLGSIILGVSAEGYAPRRLEGLQIPEDRDPDELRLTLARSGVLDVRVLTAEGEPVEDAWVSVLPEEMVDPSNSALLRGPDLTGMNETDEEGRCRVTLPKTGAYRVEASAAGSSVTARVTAGPGVTPVELRFSSGVEISGRVVGEDGIGIPGAMVRLEGESLGNVAASGPDGTFLFSPIPDGSYRLKASWKQLTSGSRDLTIAGRSLRDLELRLDRPEERGAALTGHVLGLTPEEVSRVEVRAFHPEHAPRSGRPDPEGVYRFEGLQPGDWNVQAFTSDGRHAEGTVQIPSGAREATLDLELRKGLTLTGRVLVDGKPLSGGDVQAWARERNPIASAPVAFDGTFTLAGLDAGAVTLVLLDSEGFAGTRSVNLTDDQEVTLALSTGRLAGRAVTETGAPVEDATVAVDAWLQETGTRYSAPGARTGADGVFEIPGLGAGTYKVKISKEGFAPVETTVTILPGGSAPPVVVALKERPSP